MVFYREVGVGQTHCHPGNVSAEDFPLLIDTDPDLPVILRFQGDIVTGNAVSPRVRQRWKNRNRQKKD
jgi:hypothetical protein